MGTKSRFPVELIEEDDQVIVKVIDMPAAICWVFAWSCRSRAWRDTRLFARRPDCPSTLLPSDH
jgi:hypothetical protein